MIETHFHIQTPLGSWSVEKPSLSQIPDPVTGGATLLHVDVSGRRWYFREDGPLAALEVGDVTIVYQRDPGGRLQRVSARRAARIVAAIEFAYDAHGRVAALRQGDGASATFGYDAVGRLHEVVRPGCRVRYEYRDGQLHRVWHDGEIAREFFADPRGRLAREQGPAGLDIAYAYERTAEGVTVSEQTRGSVPSRTTHAYDLRMRPVFSHIASGARMQWRHAEAGGVGAELTTPDGVTARLERNADGRHLAVTLPDGTTLEASRDAAGRIEELRENGQFVRRQRWTDDGRLISVANTATSWHFEYRDDGTVERVLVTPPEAGPRFTDWLEVCFAPSGNIASLRDSSGWTHASVSPEHAAVPLPAPEGPAIRHQLDAAGRPLEVVCGTAWKLALIYDRDGRITSTTYRALR